MRRGSLVAPCGSRRASSSSSGRRHVDRLDAEAPRRARDGRGHRGSKEPLEGLGRKRPSLWQEGEDAAAAVVHDDHRARGPAPAPTVVGGAYQCAEVVQKCQIAHDRHDGVRPRGRPSEGGGDDAVDAVGPPVGPHPRRCGQLRSVPLEIPDRHGRGGDNGRPGFDRSRQATGQRRLVERGRVSEHLVEDGLGRLLCEPPSLGPFHRRALALVRPEGVRGRGDERAGIGAHHPADDPVGVPPLPVRIHCPHLGPLGGGLRHVLPEHPRGPGLADLQHHVGPQGPADGVVAQQRVGGCHHAASIEPASGEGIGEQRPTETLGERDERPLAPRRRCPRTRDDQSACPGTGRDLRTDPRRGRGPVEDRMPGGATGPTGGEVLRVAAERLSKGQVGVHRTRPVGAARRLGDQAGADRAPACPVGHLGHTGRAAPAQGRTEETSLVDGLRGAHSLELRGAVGGAHDERDAVVVCLDHARVQLRRSGAARGQDHDGPGGRRGEPDGEEPRAALVQPDVDRDLGTGGQRDRHRRRS